MNIVRIIDFGARQFWQMEVEFSLVLEYCSNGQLSDYLGESISKSRKLGWIRSITSAVVYLHDKKITHQDLKPDNVLLAEGDVIKLADFGLARRFGRPVKGTECKHVLPTLHPAISQLALFQFPYNILPKGQSLGSFREANWAVDYDINIDTEHIYNAEIQKNEFISI
jgi:serine/threonine protein kinase